MVGVNEDTAQGLLNEDGVLEVGRGSFSIEPFLYANGRLITWNEARKRQRLARGVPIPSVEWTAGALALTVTAYATGQPGRASLFARYRVRNRAERPLRATLFLAVRPFQVNPPWQFLNTPGGIARISALEYDGTRVRVNGSRMIVPLTTAAAPGAFDRLLATQLGAAAAERLSDGESGIFVGLANRAITAVPLAEVRSPKSPPDMALVRLAQELAQ